MTDCRTVEWGRIAEDGTVYVKTADGERPVGSWQAGSADEGLAFYQRKYDDLAAEVAILEARAGSPNADPKAIRSAVGKLRDSVPTAAVVGDLASLEARLAAVVGRLDERVAEQAERRAAAAAAAADRKRALVEEAERLSTSEEWRATGDRYRAIVEEWKGVRGVDRKTDTELWERFSAARKEFDRRRRAHFAEVDKQREVAAERKQQLAAEAEKLVDSTDWAATARRFKDLMAQWKAAGRAGREADDALWVRFKSAQDTFFARRAESLSARDAELRSNLEAKEALLREAESLEPERDLEGARKRLRTIHDRWERVGHVPREAMGRLDDRLATVERRVREAGAGERRVAAPESRLVIRLRESVDKLEARLARARASGDAKLAAETEQALTTQRAWLEQAERSGG
jgi:hypothetical protein